MLIVARENCQPWVHHQALKIPQPREHSLNRDMLPNNGSEGLHSKANIVMETWSAVLLTSKAMIKMGRCDQLSKTSEPFTCKKSQEWPISIFSSQYPYIIKENVMRFNIMITSRKMLWSFIKFSQLIFKGDVWRSVWRICMWLLGLKGLSSMPTSNLGVSSKFAQWFSRHLKEFKNLSMLYFAQLCLCR